MKKIAVVTPVFNGEKYIRECLNSVRFSISGERFEIEHVIVDDGSTDNSENIIQNSKFSKLSYYHLENNSGPFAARNFGVKQTDADFLFFLDHDDVIFQNSLKRLFDFCEREKADWVYGDFLRTDGSLAYLTGQDYYGHQFENPGDLLTSIFMGEHFFQQNCLFNKELFDSAGGFNEELKIAEDLDLFIRFTLSGFIPKYLPGPLYLHRLHESNLSKVTFREDNFPAHKVDLKTLYKKYKNSLTDVLNEERLDRIEKFLTNYG